MQINAASAYNPMIRRAPVRAGGGDPTPVATPPATLPPVNTNNQQDKVMRVANDVTVVAAAATGLVATIAGLFGNHSATTPAPTAAPVATPVVATPVPLGAPVAAPKPATTTVSAASTSSGGMQAFGQMISNFFSGIVNFFKSLFGGSSTATTTPAS